MQTKEIHRLIGRRMDLGSVKLKSVEAPTVELFPLEYDPQTSTWTKSSLLTDNQLLSTNDQPKSSPPLTGDQSKSSLLRFLTFNLMKEKCYAEERMKALVKIIISSQPHFICFQENLVHLEKIFREDKFIQQNYFLSPVDGQGPGFRCSLWSSKIFRPSRLTKVRSLLVWTTLPASPPLFACLSSSSVSGALCLSLPLSLVNPTLDIDSGSNRPSIIGVYKINNFIFSIASVHLTSGLNVNNRIQQIQTIQKNLLQRSKHCVMLGDFNAAVEDDHRFIETNSFVDTWIQLKKNTKTNSDMKSSGANSDMRSSGTRHQGNDHLLVPYETSIIPPTFNGPRLDKILFFSEAKEQNNQLQQTFSPISIKRIGKENLFAYSEQSSHSDQSSNTEQTSQTYFGLKNQLFISDHLGLLADFQLT